MADISTINGIAEDDIASWNGTAAGDVTSVNGNDWPHLNTGGLYYWGTGNYVNAAGALGGSAGSTVQHPIQVGSDTDWAGTMGGADGGYATKSNGKLYAYGRNQGGQLGIGSTENQSAPVQVGSATDWLGSKDGNGLNKGANKTVIKSDGTMWSWGQNFFGSLGLGDVGVHTFAAAGGVSVPTQVGSATDWTNVNNGIYVTIAINSSGHLYFAGWNSKGQFGNSTSDPDRNDNGGSNAVAFTRLGSDTDWARVSIGGGNWVIATKTDGTLWSWGEQASNRGGILGDGNGSAHDRSSPVQIGTDTNWDIPSAGDFHNQCTKTDGTCWGWGVNSSADQLGLTVPGGTRDRKNYSAPVQMGTGTTWGANGFTEGGTQACQATVIAMAGGSGALTSDGKMWHWGSGYSNAPWNSTFDASGPTQVGTSTDWISLSFNSGSAQMIEKV
jgi:hypothetical protein